MSIDIDINIEKKICQAFIQAEKKCILKYR